jgi:hypothetical protein
MDLTHTGFWTVYNGMVAEQADRDIEPDSDDWVLFDQLRRLRADPFRSISQRELVGGSGYECLISLM